MTQPTESNLTCAWVPGTLDRVRVSSSCGPHEVDIRSVQRVLGRPAVHALYLSGRYTLSLTHDDTRRTLTDLGCTLAEPEPVSAALHVTPARPTLPGVLRGRPNPRTHHDRGGFD